MLGDVDLEGRGVRGYSILKYRVESHTCCWDFFLLDSAMAMAEGRTLSHMLGVFLKRSGGRTKHPL